VYDNLYRRAKVVQMNSIDFTIAIAPNTTSIERDMLYIKSALLYADTITLISPMASTYFDLTNEADRKNEKTIISLMDKVLPFCKISNPVYCKEIEPTLAQFKNLVFSKKYKAVPMKMKLPLIKAIKTFGNEIAEKTTELLGSGDCAELVSLVKSGRVKLYSFQSEFADDAYIREFYLSLKRALKNLNTFPLFDDQSNDLIKAAINDNLIVLNDVNRFNAAHAGMTNNLLVSLPSFEYATVDEILDIRKELENPLVRFRSKALSYSDNIQSMPWDETFRHECVKLYQKEVAPAVLEIEELTKESGFLKNLGYNIISDNSILKRVGEIGISIASAGVISTFSDVVSFDTAILATGGVYATSKIATAYREYKASQNDIKKKDLYFYYKAGEFLKNKLH